MSKDILDEAEKYTEPRTCPKCGYQFPFGKFVRRYVMGYGLSKWSCPKCHEVVKCDFIKIQMFWLAGLLVFGFLFSVLMPYVELGLLGITFLILFYVFVLLTFYYVKFEKNE